MILSICMYYKQKENFSFCYEQQGITNFFFFPYFSTAKYSQCFFIPLIVEECMIEFKNNTEKKFQTIFSSA